MSNATETIHAGATLTADGVTDHAMATDADIKFAMDRKRDALWYAFGITDGSAELSERLCDAIRSTAMVGFSPAVTFSDDQYAAALANRIQGRFLPSVQGAWQAFVAELIG